MCVFLWHWCDVISWNFIIFLCTDAEGLVCIEILSELLCNQAMKRHKKVLYHVQVCIYLCMYASNTCSIAILCCEHCLLSPSDTLATLLINMYTHCWTISQYIHRKLLFVLISCRRVMTLIKKSQRYLTWSDCSEKSLGTVVILPLIHIGVLWLTFSSLKQLILDQSRQNGYQTIPFSVYIHNLMFVFILEWLFWKEPWYCCDFTTYTHRCLMTNVFIPETANTWPKQTKWVSNNSI